MSVKIYSGFRYAGEGGLLGCYNQLNALRKTIHDMGEAKYHNFLKLRTMELIDAPYTNLRPEIEDDSDKGPFWRAQREWSRRKKANESTQMRDPSVDMNFTISLYPVDDMVLGIPWVDDYDFSDFLNKQPFIEEYGYWNNTDKPDDISDHDWNLRERHWQCVLNASTFNDVGLTMQLHWTYGAMFMPDTSKTIFAMMETPQQRAERWGTQVTRHEKIKELMTAHSSPLNAINSLSTGKIEAIQEGTRWLETPDGIDAIAETTARLAKELPVITENLFYGKED